MRGSVSDRRRGTTIEEIMVVMGEGEGEEARGTGEMTGETIGGTGGGMTGGMIDERVGVGERDTGNTGPEEAEREDGHEVLHEETGIVHDE